MRWDPADVSTWPAEWVAAVEREWQRSMRATELLVGMCEDVGDVFPRGEGPRLPPARIVGYAVEQNRGSETCTLQVLIQGVWELQVQVPFHAWPAGVSL